jgi:hypothetical protein
VNSNWTDIESDELKPHRPSIKHIFLNELHIWLSLWDMESWLLMSSHTYLWPLIKCSFLQSWIRFFWTIDEMRCEVTSWTNQAPTEFLPEACADRRQQKPRIKKVSPKNKFESPILVRLLLHAVSCLFERNFFNWSSFREINYQLNS